MLTSLSLAGTWDLALDPNGLGEREGWAAGRLGDTIVLPGSVDEAQKTPPATGATMAHLSRRHPYVGQAWYGRDVAIAAEAAPADDLPELSLPALAAWWQRVAAEHGEPGA